MSSFTGLLVRPIQLTLLHPYLSLALPKLLSVHRRLFRNYRFIEHHRLPQHTRSLIHKETPHTYLGNRGRGSQPISGTAYDLKNPSIFGQERDVEKISVCLETNSSSWRRYGHGRKDEFEHVICKFQPGFFVRSTLLPYRYR